MHHVYPQQFRKAFKAAGIDIDNYLVRIKQLDHIGIHQGGYNADWQAFLKGRNITASKIFAFGLQMMQKYGCDASVLP